MNKTFLLVLTFALSFFYAYPQGGERKVIAFEPAHPGKGSHIHNGRISNGEFNRFTQGDAWIKYPVTAVPLGQVNEFFTFTAVFETNENWATWAKPEIRWSENGKKWTDWSALSADEESGMEIEKNGKFRSTLAFIGAEMKFFQMRIHYVHQMIPAECRSMEVEASPLMIQKVNLHFYSPGEVTQPQPRTAADNGVQPELLACPCPQPSYVNRTGWGCPDGQNPSCSSPSYTTVTHLIVHHSAGSNSSSNWAAVVNSIWNDHVNVNGWCDIGYNWLIDPNGVLYEGRGGGNNVVGAHFCGYNTGTMGTCMMGNYMTVNPSALSMNKLKELLSWKCCDAGIDPLASSNHNASAMLLNHISGHRNGCSTSCPGDLLYNQLPQLRTDVSNHIASNCTPVAPANDNICNASELTVSTACSFASFSNANATNSTVAVINDTLCDAPSNGDVWFKAMVPASGMLIIDTQPGSINDVGMGLYTGTCTSPSFHSCYRNGSTYGPWMPIASLSGLTPGSWIYIRVWEFNNNNFGTFGICAWDPCPALPAAPQITALPSALCDSDSVVLTLSGGNPGTGGAFVWYEGTCGQSNQLGTGNSYATTVSSTTTFYVRAEGNCGVSQCGSATVTVVEIPEADFTYVVNANQADFTDASLDATSWQWNFGDGNTSAAQNPSHSYGFGGIFTVTLIVTNACGTDTTTEEVEIALLGNSLQQEFAPVQFFPNPSQGVIQLAWEPFEGTLNCWIADMTGKVVRSEVVQGMDAGMQWSTGLPQGSYLLSIRIRDQVITRRMVVATP